MVIFIYFRGIKLIKKLEDSRNRERSVRGYKNLLFFLSTVNATRAIFQTKKCEEYSGSSWMKSLICMQLPGKWSDRRKNASRVKANVDY